MCQVAFGADNGVIASDRGSREAAIGVGVRNVAACWQRDFGQAACFETGVAGRVFVGKSVFGIRIGAGVPVWEVNFRDEVCGHGPVRAVLANVWASAAEVRLNGVRRVFHDVSGCRA